MDDFIIVLTMCEAKILFVELWSSLAIYRSAAKGSVYKPRGQNFDPLPPYLDSFTK